MGEQRAVGADPHHEVAVVELLLLEHRGLAAVDAGRALGVEAHPAEPAAQVGGVDRVEAALGVGVEDPVADVERAVVLLGLLVLVQRLAVAERPLTLAALGARDLGVVGGAWRCSAGQTSGWRFLDEGGERRSTGGTTSSGSRRPAGQLRGGRLRSGMPTHHAAGTPEVHVASNHEVRRRRSSDHVKQSHGSDALPTRRNLMM